MIRHKVMTMTEFYEADAFDLSLMVGNLQEVDRDAAERMRMMVWAALAPNSKRQLAPEDILTFSWEKQNDTASRPTTREDFEKAFNNYLPKNN